MSFDEKFARYLLLKIDVPNVLIKLIIFIKYDKLVFDGISLTFVTK